MRLLQHSNACLPVEVQSNCRLPGQALVEQAIEEPDLSGVSGHGPAARTYRPELANPVDAQMLRQLGGLRPKPPVSATAIRGVVVGSLRERFPQAQIADTLPPIPDTFPVRIGVAILVQTRNATPCCVPGNTWIGKDGRKTGCSAATADSGAPSASRLV